MRLEDLNYLHEGFFDLIGIVEGVDVIVSFNTARLIDAIAYEPADEAEMPVEPPSTEEPHASLPEPPMVCHLIIICSTIAIHLPCI